MYSILILLGKNIWLYLLNIMDKKIVFDSFTWKNNLDLCLIFVLPCSKKCFRWMLPFLFYLSPELNMPLFVVLLLLYQDVDINLYHIVYSLHQLLDFLTYYISESKVLEMHLYFSCSAAWNKAKVSSCDIIIRRI